VEHLKISPKQALDVLLLEECLIVHKIGYRPGEDVVYFKDGERVFNSYTNSPFLKKIIPNKDSKIEDFENIYLILLNIVGDDKNGVDWVLNWLAGIFQNPTKKVTTALILHGEHGTGKGLFFEEVMGYILKQNYNKVGFNQISSEFTSWLKNKLLVFCNEIVHYENKQQVSQSMKEVVSDSHFTLREMRKDPVSYPNFSRICIASNGINPFKMEAGDRRFSVFRSKKLKNGVGIYNNLMENLDLECQAFVNYMLNLNINWNNANKPYLNKQREEIIYSNMNSCEAFIKQFEDSETFLFFMEEYISALKKDNQNFVDKFSAEYFIEDGLGYISASGLYAIYCEFCHQEGFLRPAGKNTLMITVYSRGYEKIKKYHKGTQVRCVCLGKL
jgi:phage/plasmid-associated DNA primase